MNKKISLYLIVILLLFALVSAAPSCKNDADVAMVQTALMLAEDEESGDEDTDTETEDTTTEDEQLAEPAVLSFATQYENNKYIPFDELLTIMGIYNDRPNINFHVDTVGDNIYADPNVEPKGYQPYADIVGWGSLMLQFQSDPPVPPLTDIWPPGYYDAHLNSWTVYPNNWVPYNGNTWYMTFIILDENVPFTHTSYTGTYASVSVTDDNPENDFVPMEQYPLDFNQYTDRWDTIYYIPGSSWTYLATGENFAELNTSSFVMIYKNVIGWFYSGEEIDSTYFAYRMWGHWIDQNWDLNTSGADSIMSDPQITPVPVSSDEPVQVFDTIEGKRIEFSGSFTLCDRALCTQKSSGETEQAEYWCECDGCTSLDSCDCRMFSYDPLNMSIARLWEEVAVPGEKITKNENLRYHCFCVKPID